MIVATFFVKDIYREDANKRAAAIDAAQATFTTTDALNKIEMGLATVLEELKVIETRQANPMGPVWDREGNDEKLIQIFYQQISSSLSLAGEANTKVGGGNAGRCATDLLNELNEAESKHQAELSDAQSKDETRPFTFDISVINVIGQKTVFCQQTIISAGTNLKLKAEWWATFWARCGYVLFGAGWILAVGGKLAKDDKIEMESE